MIFREKNEKLAMRLCIIIHSLIESTNAKYDFILYVRSNGFFNKANAA